MFPIIMPMMIPVNTEPSKCPKCNKEENKKEVCGHCNFEYKIDESDGKGFLIYFVIAVIVFIVSLYVMKTGDILCYHSIFDNTVECGMESYFLMIIFSFIIGVAFPVSLPVLGIVYLLSVL